MIRNETFLINTYIFGGWGWRWWQDIEKPNNNMNTCIICMQLFNVIVLILLTHAGNNIDRSKTVMLSTSH